MKQRVFAKTLLSVYNLIDNFCDCLDKTVYAKGICQNEDAFNLANDVLLLTERKVALINLKVKIEKSIEDLPEVDSKILILKYVDSLSVEKVAEVLQMSERNLFRRLSCSLLNFDANMQKMGVTLQNFKSEFQHETWIFNRFNRLFSEEVIKLKTKVLHHQTSLQAG